MTWEEVTVTVVMAPLALAPAAQGTSTVTGSPLERMPNKGPGFTPKAMAFFG